MTDWTTNAIPWSVIGGAVTLAVANGKAYLERRGKARFSSLRAITALEAYARDCEELLDYLDSLEYFQALFQEEKELDNEFRLVPELNPFPDDVDWQALGMRLSVRLLDFRNRVTSSRLAAQLKYSPYLPDALAKVKQYTAARAVDAIELSQDLRRRSNLASFSSLVDTGLLGRLRDRVAGYDRERDAIRRRTTPEEVLEGAPGRSA